MLKTLLLQNIKLFYIPYIHFFPFPSSLKALNSTRITLKSSPMAFIWPNSVVSSQSSSCLTHQHCLTNWLLPPLETFYFLVGLWFELRASHLQSRCYNTWATSLDCFVLVILEMGVSQTICLGWPLTGILLISASQVARIRVSHQHLSSSFLEYIS
jgi:hypothetical protein